MSILAIVTRSANSSLSSSSAGAIYPGRVVRAALLYTQTPQLIALPPELMAAYKARFEKPEESFSLPPVD